MSNTDDLETFLRELSELSKRTGFWIAGCGECGSPWIRNEGADGSIAAQYLQPLPKLDGYECSREGHPFKSDTVVRI